MKIRTLALLILALFICADCSADVSDSQSLANAVQRMLTAPVFDISVLDPEASIVIAHGADRRFYTKEEIGDVIETAKKAGTTYKASDFKVLSEDASGQFASITYEVTWEASVGDKNVTTRMLSHEIWERQNSQWHRLFAALDAKEQ